MTKHGERRRILCVLRKPSDRRVLMPALLEQYEVVAAVTAHQAVAYAVHNPVDGVVLDSEFLTEQGWSVAQTFKSVNPCLPVVLFVEDHQYKEIPQTLDAIANTPARVLEELNRLLDLPVDRAPVAPEV